ncbi:MAG: hypothetical protein ACP5IM_05330 [Candidatus Bathyarchaeia archaeon]
MVQVKTEDLKALSDSVKELNESYEDLISAVKGTAKEARETKKLWRKGNNSILIKVGLALIAFPDPTISDIVGTALVAAGTVQMGIRHGTLYVEDVYKTFHKTFKDLLEVKHNL